MFDSGVGCLVACIAGLILLALAAYILGPAITRVLLSVGAI